MADARTDARTDTRTDTRKKGGAGGVGTAARKRADGRVLLIGVAPGDGKALAAVLRHDGYRVATAADAGAAAEVLKDQRKDGPPDVALAELRADDPAGAALLFEIRALAPLASVIVLTGYATLESALGALRGGAYDYLAKPVDVDELRATVARAMERRRLERELAERVRELEAAQTELRELNGRLRERVEEATAALRGKVDERDAANAQLRAAQEQHHTFVAMVAHEMRGPLGPIINYAQLAKRPSATPEKRAEYLDIIVEHAMRMNRLVDDLQTATRLSTGKFALQRQQCDVAAAVAGFVEQYGAAHRDRPFTIERPDGPILAEVDPDRVLQAVRNLVDNAIKYSAEGGVIELRVWREGGRAHIQVGDYGAGIPEAERERIFKPFTRLERRSADTHSAGLGLYITRGIVAEHGGELSVANRAGAERANGALFTIALPLHAPEVPVVADSPEAPAG